MAGLLSLLRVVSCEPLRASTHDESRSHALVVFFAGHVAEGDKLLNVLTLMRGISQSNELWIRIVRWT